MLRMAMMGMQPRLQQRQVSPVSTEFLVDITRALLRACPEAAQEQDNDGLLPLHHAVNGEPAKETLLAVLEAFPEAAMCGGHQNCLPLHRALCNLSTLGKKATTEIILALLNAGPEAAGMKDMGTNYPLLYAVKYEHEVEVVRALLEHCPEAAQPGGELHPLHTSLCTMRNARQEESGRIARIDPDVVLALLKACPEAARKFCNVSTEVTVLSLALHEGAPPIVIHALLKEWPGAAQLPHYPDASSCSTKTNVGNFPLHQAISPNRHGNIHPPETVLAVLAAFPEAAQHPQGSGSSHLALHIAANHCVPLEIFDAILHAFPAAVKTACLCDGCLPLHMSLRLRVDQPSSLESLESSLSSQIHIVKRLLQIFPDSIRHRDLQGWTPLQTALIHRNSSEIIFTILEAWPEAAHVSTGTGTIPLYNALRRPNPFIEVNRALIRAWPESVHARLSNTKVLPLQVLASVRLGQTGNIIVERRWHLGTAEMLVWHGSPVAECRLPRTYLTELQPFVREVMKDNYEAMLAFRMCVLSLNSSWYGGLAQQKNSLDLTRFGDLLNEIESFLLPCLGREKAFRPRIAARHGLREISRILQGELKVEPPVILVDNPVTGSLTMMGYNEPQPAAMPIPAEIVTDSDRL
jgi:ankyrin repeat protein